jgi:hypothetical protein
VKKKKKKRKVCGVFQEPGTKCRPPFRFFFERRGRRKGSSHGDALSVPLVHQQSRGIFSSPSRTQQCVFRVCVCVARSGRFGGMMMAVVVGEGPSIFSLLIAT